MESDDGKSSSLSSLFSYSNLVHAVSGATGSVIAISVFYPLDTVRTRLQVDDHRHAKNTFLVLKEILKEEGLEGVYLGWFPVVSALCCSNFVYFYTYNGLKSSVLGGRKKASPIVDLTLAFLSDYLHPLNHYYIRSERSDRLLSIRTKTERFINSFIPLWVRVLQDHRHHREVHRSLIHKALVVPGLYRGWLSMASTMFISSYVYFYTYASFQYCQHSLLGHGSKDKQSPTMLFDLLFAFLAGVVNVLVTTPLWVVNTRLKLQGANLHTAHFNKKHGAFKSPRKHYNGIIDCILKIINAEGVGKLWGGTVPSILLATNPAIQFMIYEALKRYFKRYMDVTELSGLMYFILGAVAKTAATVITYPLQVIQSRLRAGFAKEENTQSLKQNILHLIRTRGVGSLYKGLEAKLLQTVLTAALMFAIYEKIAAFIFKIMGLQ